METDHKRSERLCRFFKMKKKRTFEQTIGKINTELFGAPYWERKSEEASALSPAGRPVECRRRCKRRRDSGKETRWHRRNQLAKPGWSGSAAKGCSRGHLPQTSSPEFLVFLFCCGQGRKRIPPPVGSRAVQPRGLGCFCGKWWLVLLTEGSTDNPYGKLMSRRCSEGEFSSTVYVLYNDSSSKTCDCHVWSAHWSLS